MVEVSTPAKRVKRITELIFKPEDGKSSSDGLIELFVQPFSDFLVHVLSDLFLKASVPNEYII